MFVGFVAVVVVVVVVVVIVVVVVVADVCIFVVVLVLLKFVISSKFEIECFKHRFPNFEEMATVHIFGFNGVFVCCWLCFRGNSDDNHREK